MVDTIIDKRYQKLINPSPLFTIFVPSEEGLKLIARHLMEGYLNLSDEYRNYDVIYRMLHMYLSDQSCIFYEVGNMQAALGIIGIVPRLKASVFFKLLDTKLWKPQFLREIKQFFKLIMDTFELKRLSAESPDPRIAKMAVKAGFKIEGMRANDFLWNKQLYNNFLLGIVREGEIPKEQPIEEKPKPKKKRKRRK